METENKNHKMHHPLQIYCKQCGSPLGFDIVNQTYRCSYCGTLSGIQDAKKDIYEWKEMQRNKAEESLNTWDAREYHCPSCGAHIMIPQGEASATCDFCGSIGRDLFRKCGCDAVRSFAVAQRDILYRMKSDRYDKKKT